MALTQFPLETTEPTIEVTLPVGRHVLQLIVEDNAGLRSAPATVVITVQKAEEIVVSVFPASVQLSAGKTQQFNAKVTGTSNTDVVWSIKEGSAGGTITQDGLYTAPAADGTYHVAAASAADPAKIAVAAVTVKTANVVVSIEPTSVQLSAGKTQQFKAMVTGTSNTDVVWRIKEGAEGGTITQDGLYTAPQTDGTYYVEAVSAADPQKKAVAEVTVKTANVVVSVEPTSAQLSAGGTQQFKAKVTGSANTDVVWSVKGGEAGGTITRDGLYTAPKTDGTYHVMAISVADKNASDMAEVTVKAVSPCTGPTPKCMLGQPGAVKEVSVSVTPDTVTLEVGKGQQFTATVTGSDNTAVTWKADTGSINTSGLYIATTVGSDKVKATSAADPSKSAVAEVTVKAVPLCTGATPIIERCTGSLPKVLECTGAAPQVERCTGSLPKILNPVLDETPTRSVEKTAITAKNVEKPAIAPKTAIKTKPKK